MQRRKFIMKNNAGKYETIVFHAPSIVIISLALPSCKKGRGSFVDTKQVANPPRVEIRSMEMNQSIILLVTIVFIFKQTCLVSNRSDRSQ